jgi:hypothetical protein
VGFYLLATGSVYGALQWKRLEGLGGVLGMALWSQSSGVVAELGRVLCQRANARVQLTCNVFVSRPGGSGGRACWARVAHGWGFDAVQGDVQRAGKRRVHASEWLCRSRRPERAQEGTERGLEDGQRAAWAAASHWASMTAARGLGWCGSRGWLASCALVGTSMRRVASGFERGGGEVGEVSDLQVGSWRSPGRLLDAGWGLERAGVRERGRVRSWQDCLGLPPSFVSNRMGQGE